MTPWIDENPQAANVSTSHFNEISSATDISSTPDKTESDFFDDEVKSKTTTRNESWAMNRLNGKSN